MDVLTNVLDSLHLSSRVHARNELRGPWAIDMPPARYMAFHLLHRGRAYLRVNGDHDFMLLAAGDLIVLPHGPGHLLVDVPETADTIVPLDVRTAGGSCPRFVLGENGPASTLLCGYFDVGIGEGWIEHPLLPLLPQVIHLTADSGQSTPWMQSTLQILADEAGSQRPGTDAILRRLTDVLFVQVIRSWLEREKAPPGWLGALRDPQVARALAAMHAAPERTWTVDDLADSARMSRSAFAARFTELVGRPPIGYLIRLRMRLAAGMLHRGLRIQDVAEQVGYGSEAAFSAAFKRERGIAPSRHRRASSAERGSGARP